MRDSKWTDVRFRCERCRELKPARNFDIRFDGQSIIRSDCCDDCRRIIDQLRWRERLHA